VVAIAVFAIVVAFQGIELSLVRNAERGGAVSHVDQPEWPTA